MTRETINNFNGENNVTKITSDNGTVSYLSQSVNFRDEAYSKGGVTLASYEQNNKHALFLFNAAKAEVGRYYLCKSLQGAGDDAIAASADCMVVFKSWDGSSWVPCVSKTSQVNLAQKSVSF